MEWMVYGITFFIMARAVCYLIDDYIKELVDIKKRRSE